MKYKLVGIFICTLLLLTIFPTIEALNPDDDVTIKISAGRLGLDIGRGIGFKVVNNGDEDINFTENLVYDYYFRDNMDSNTTEHHTCGANGWHNGMRYPAYGLLLISLSIETENIKVEREGICIFHLVSFISPFSENHL